MRSVQSTLFALLVASSAAYADTTFNLTQGVSPISHDVYELHMTVFWICVVIGVVVFGAMFYAMIFHRKSVGAKPASFHSHPFLEIAWTIVPALILLVLAIPATKVLLNMNNIDQEQLTIKITGYQWKWHYEYLEDGVSFFSDLSTPVNQMHNLAPKGENYLREVDHPLVLPIHKKIRFLITSNDVNHAWWVPDFAVKRDAISGFINEAWTIINKPGTYRGQCAELCGINHAFMPIVVVATTEQGYKDFIAKQKGQATQGEAELNKQWTMEELMSQGEKVYGHICAACHQPNGAGLPPTFPALKGSRVTTGQIDTHIDKVMNGVSGTAMQAFKSQLSDAELAAVITYERNAFGNNTGSSIQPIQIKAIRDGKSVSEALTIKPSGKVAASPVTPAVQAKQPAATGSAQPAAPGAAAVSPTTPSGGGIPANAPAAITGPAAASPTSAIPAAGTSSNANSPAIKAAPSAQAATTSMNAGSQPPLIKETVAPGTSITVTPPANETTTITITTTPISGEKGAPQPETGVPQKPQALTQPSASIAAAPPSAEELKTAMERGEKVYLSRCAVCHQPQGTGLPPTFPALKGSKVATGPVEGHLDLVLNGKQGTAMVPFKDQLNDQELADVITYERNAFGNNTNTLVKTDDIKAARQHDQTK